MTTWKLGTELSAPVQADALRRYVHRFTGDHKPQWVKDEAKTPLQFIDDRDWLAHTRFAVTKRGALHGSIHHCESSPTWPNGHA